MLKSFHRAPAQWFKSTTRPQDITLAITITIMSLTICNKVREKMPSTTFINDAQKCSKNIITCKELGEDLPAVRITPTFINDAYKCNTLLNRHLPNGQNQTSTFPCTIEQALSLYPWVHIKGVDLML